MAKQLSISPAHLSQLLSGKRPITLRVAMQIAEKLEMSPKDRALLLKQAMHKGRDQALPKKAEFQTLGEEEFEPISEWYYFAILSLGLHKDNRASAKWVAEQLGLPFSEAKEAYEKLRMLGFIEEKGGRYRQSSKPLHTTRDIPSQALRKFHRQHLDLAKDRIETVPVELREYSTMTMAISRKKLPRAKKMIHEFKLKLNKYLEEHDADDVYTLAIQLFPVTTKAGG